MPLKSGKTKRFPWRNYMLANFLEDVFHFMRSSLAIATLPPWAQTETPQARTIFCWWVMCLEEGGPGMLPGPKADSIWVRNELVFCEAFGIFTLFSLQHDYILPHNVLCSNVLLKNIFSVKFVAKCVLSHTNSGSLVSEKGRDPSLFSVLGTVSNS
jgi:hypothetical protein